MSKIVMFIDDDDAFLAIMRRACRKIAVISLILEATDGSSALSLLEERLRTGAPPPDTVFVDINMPIMDGFGFLAGFRDLRDKHEELKHVKPVAVLTSSDQAQDRERAHGLGADEYIVKGFSLSDMRATIARLVK